MDTCMSMFYGRIDGVFVCNSTTKAVDVNSVLSLTPKFWSNENMKKAMKAVVEDGLTISRAAQCT